MKTIIMAGGRGTRISELFPNIPKPLIPIRSMEGIEKPVLEWEIESLRAQGFKEIIITVSHMADKIKNYFGDGSKLGVSIEYYTETIPLGNAGALFKLRERLGDDPFLLLIADAMFDVDFNRMVEYHKSKKALVTLFTHPNSHPHDSSVLITDSQNCVVSWLTKEDDRPEYYKNRVNAGLQILDPSVLDMTNIDSDLVGETDPDGVVHHVDMDRQILKPLCGKGVMFCYDSPEYCKDMGTPERYNQVCQDFQMGVVKSKNLRQPQKAIFIDRDGTINKHIGFLRNPQELVLLPGVVNAIKKINCSGFLAIVITNQPVIARGEVTVEELEVIHNKLETLLGKEGAYIDGLYYCPHHPDKGYEGEIVELKVDCACRKPKPGLILMASKDFNICLEESWMIGDGSNDVGCGKNAGCRTALIKDGTSENNDYGADIVVDSLQSAVDIILR